MERASQSSGRMSWEGNTTFWYFSWFKYGVGSVEDCERSVCNAEYTQTKRVESSQNL